MPFLLSQQDRDLDLTDEKIKSFMAIPSQSKWSIRWE